MLQSDREPGSHSPLARRQRPGTTPAGSQSCAPLELQRQRGEPVGNDSPKQKVCRLRMRSQQSETDLRSLAELAQESPSPREDTQPKSRSLVARLQLRSHNSESDSRLVDIAAAERMGQDDPKRRSRPNSASRLGRPAPITRSQASPSNVVLGLPDLPSSPLGRLKKEGSPKLVAQMMMRSVTGSKERDESDGVSPRSERSQAKLLLNFSEKSSGSKSSASLDEASTSASTNSGSSPPAASMLLRAMQKKRRALMDGEDPDPWRSVDEVTPRSPDFAPILSGGRRTTSCGRCAVPRTESPAGEFFSEKLERRICGSGARGGITCPSVHRGSSRGAETRHRSPGSAKREAGPISPTSPASALLAKLAAGVPTGDTDDLGGSAPLRREASGLLNMLSAGRPGPQPPRQLDRFKSNDSEEEARLFSKESGLLTRRRMRAPELQPLPVFSIDTTKAPEEKEVCIRSMEEEYGADVKIFDLYYWDEVIQEDGSGGKVVVCSPKVPGELSPVSAPSSPTRRGSTSGDASGSSSNEKGTHVMKIKSKEKLRKHNAEAEFRQAHMKMLNLVPHMGILPLHEVLEDDVFYYVVMPKANGGSLLRSLVEEHPDGIMPEREIKRIMREILSALNHLHKQGILHRDIKVDNLVVQVDDEPSSPGGKFRKVQLIDFDIADGEWLPDSPSKKGPGWVGTVRNSAPETFRGIFSQRSDLYSVGTVLYLLMAGRQAFDEEIYEAYNNYSDLDAISEKLAEAQIDWELSCWKQHPACRNFCMWLLSYEPEKRPHNAEEAAAHHWFTGRQREHRD